MFRFLFPRLTAETDSGRGLFDAVTAEARSPHWFVDGQVPDTIDGRFSMLATVMALVILRLERSGNDGASVALTERFVEVMVAEHRELGLGDPTLGRTVSKLVGSLSRRLDLWRAAAAESAEWERAARYSVYGGGGPDPAALRHTEAGLSRLWARLRELPDERLLEGRLQ